MGGNMHETLEVAHVTRSTHTRSKMITILTALGIIVTDVISKYWWRENYTVVKNYGLTFSIPSSSKFALVFTTAVLAVLFFYFYKNKSSLGRTALFAFGLMFGGALANFFERIFT